MGQEARWSYRQPVWQMANGGEDDEATISKSLHDLNRPETLPSGALWLIGRV